MKIRLILSAIVIALFRNVCAAQDPDKKILMAIAGRDVEAGEFLRMFNKSPDPENKTTLNNFLDQFIDFKLKVADAMSEGYDTTKAYRDELNGYRQQLAQKYLTDNEIKEKLLRKAYERSLLEIKASHILVACAPDADPQDSARAYNKALEIRERIIMGEQTFEQIARSVSDDRSVQQNGGNLGYFTVFQLITPFEDSAYSLDSGSISMPVRTTFGYHLIKVSGKRPSVGKIKVAHIMKAAPPGSSDSVIQKAKNDINDIYLQLRNGASFRDLAVKYSDHRETAANGGEMNMFGTGEIIPDFSEPAFAIKDTGDFSVPVRTNYGFHIIKLLERKPPESFEEARPYLESKLNKSLISSIGRRSFIESLKKDYNLKIDTSAFNWFAANTDTLIILGRSSYNREKLPAGDIITFADQNVTTSEFSNYLEKNVKTVFRDDPSRFIKNSLESFIEEEIMKYEDSVLEQKYPDFRYLMNEFHDGILLFDISSVKVWNKVRDDSTGFKEFYKNHEHDFMSERGIEAKIYTLNEQNGMKKLESAYKKFKGSQDCDSRLYAKFNRKDDSLLVIMDGKWMAGDDPDLDGLRWVTGVQSFTKNGLPSVIEIKEVKEKYQLSFDEAKADALTSYQEWLTAEWVKQLKSKYPVEIDNLVFEEIKKRITDE